MELSTNAQTVFFGEGAVMELGPLLDSLQASRILFVVDGASYSASSASHQLNDVLESHKTVHFGEFELNPKILDVERGIQTFKEHLPDVVVAFGGGTALDLAKMIRALSRQQHNLHDIVTARSEFDPDVTPLVAIPTTAGTGSEATHFAVVYRDGEKHSVAHSGLLPNFVIIDPKLTYSMPSSITATTGLDALCQAIESIWAVAATDESVVYASRCIALAIKHLEPAVHSPTAESRRAMCEAAHLAGKAINISKTTASHAISYRLTTRYGIPHGVAVAVTLPQILEYNSQVSVRDCVDPRGAQHVRSRIGRILSLLQVENGASARQKLEELIDSVGCPVSLHDMGIVDDGAVQDLAAQVSIERMTNNPRRLMYEQLVKLLTESAKGRRSMPLEPHFMKRSRKLLRESKP